MSVGHVFRPGTIVRARGESWVVHRHVAGTHGSVLDVRGRGADNRGTRASFLLPYEPIEHLPSSDVPRKVRPNRWRRVARAVLADATPSYDALRSPVRAAIAVLPFQLEPVLAIVRGVAARVLIADEVGLGKTIQAGLVVGELLERRRDAHVLIVTPAGLRGQWQAELHERFALDSTLLDSASIARQSTQWSGNPWSIPGIVLTSLDYVKRPEVARALESLIWDVLVFDEAHALAGRSDRATAASVLARRARTLVMLTATPHSGDDDAFARLASVGDFSNRFPLVVFRRTRLDVGISSSRRTVSVRVRPTAHESAMHTALMTYARLVWTRGSSHPAARLAMPLLTRRACSSAWSLARSVETRLRLLSTDEPAEVLQMTLPFGGLATTDDEPCVELSAPGLADRWEERRWLEELLRLARLAERTESKQRALRRLLRRAREPAIVFTEYRDTLHQLAHSLRDFEPAQLHGGMTANERHDVLRRFVAGDVTVLLATDAASEGLNLHHRCRLVVNLELPWTPIRLEQRIGRVERLGQTRRVHAVHLLAANTCEEESVAALVTRMRHVAGVLGGMRAGVSEQQVATAALGGDAENADLKADRLGEPPRVSLPAGVIVGDCRDSAREEAARLEQVRFLVQHASHDGADRRPCVTVLTSRLTSTHVRSMSDWVYRLVVEDADGQALWTTAIGLRDEIGAVPLAGDELRRWLVSLERIAEPAFTSIAKRLLSSFLSVLGPPLALAIRRERAIAERLQHERARLASSLLQRGLFDRRAERAAAAQNVTLEEASGRCERRLAELTGQSRIRIDRRLAFGVFRR